VPRFCLARVHLRARGFTRAELVIVVGIIGLLAAIAIPSFVRYRMRATTAEAVTNLQAIFEERGGLLRGVRRLRGRFVAGSRHPSGTAEASADIDADGAPSFFAYVSPARGQLTGLDGPLPGTSCAGTGVFDPASGAKNATHTPGPCDAGSGKIEF